MSTSRADSTLGIREVKTGDVYGYAQRTVNARYDETLKSVEHKMGNVMREASNDMKDFIDTRGVHNTVPNGNGRGPGGAGHMASAVDSKTWRVGDTIHGDFGWLPGTDRKKWYGWQESGTYEKGMPGGDPDPRKLMHDPSQGSLPPRGIRPMLALHDAHRDMKLNLREQFKGRR